MLALFKHVLNRRLIDHQIRFAAFPLHLDAVPVIPLNDAVNFFAIAQHNHHRRPRLHLLLIIKILGIGLLWRRCLLSAVAAHGAVASIGALSPFHALGTIMPLWPFTAFLRLNRRCIVVSVIFRTRQRWTNQLAVGEVFSVDGFTACYGNHSDFLHVALPWIHALALINLIVWTR